MRVSITACVVLLVSCASIEPPPAELRDLLAPRRDAGAPTTSALREDGRGLDDLEVSPLLWRRSDVLASLDSWDRDPTPGSEDDVSDDKELAAPDGQAAAEEQGEQADATALAKKTQNPIANMISVPFQSNFFFGVGLDDDLMYQMLVQPIVPVAINEDWNLINRAIVPIVYDPGQSAFRASVGGSLGPVVPGQGSTAGLGDIQYQGFFSPSDSSGLIWGVGPVIQFPSATDERLGARRWAAGPGFVGLIMEGPWVAGAVVSNVWSIGDSSRSNVNAATLQPFVNYNLGQGWYAVTSPLITADWKADGGNAYKVPVGGGIGKIFKVGKQPINAQVQSFYDVVSPYAGPDWEMRFQLQFLF